MSSFLDLLTINTLLYAPWQVCCKNNNFLHRTKNYPVFRDVTNLFAAILLQKKEGENSPSLLLTHNQ